MSMIDLATAIAGFSSILQLPASVESLKRILGNPNATTDIANTFATANAELHNIVIHVSTFANAFAIVAAWKSLHDLMTKFSNDGADLFAFAKLAVVRSQFHEVCLDHFTRTREPGETHVLRQLRHFTMQNASVPSMKAFVTVHTTLCGYVGDLRDTNTDGSPWWVYIEDVFASIDTSAGLHNYDDLHDAITKLELCINVLLTRANQEIMNYLTQVISICDRLEGHLSTVASV